MLDRNIKAVAIPMLSGQVAAAGNGGHTSVPAADVRYTFEAKKKTDRNLQGIANTVVVKTLC